MRVVTFIHKYIFRDLDVWDFFYENDTKHYKTNSNRNKDHQGRFSSRMRVVTCIHKYIFRDLDVWDFFMKMIQNTIKLILIEIKITKVDFLHTL